MIGLLVFTILLKVLAAFSLYLEQGDDALPWVFLMPVVNVVLVIGVASHRGISYRMVAVFTVIGLLNSAAGIFSGPLWATLIDLGLAAALIGLSLFLQARLVPDHTLVKERYTNAQGQERMRNTYRFREYGE